jgi:hypothetical protein
MGNPEGVGPSGDMVRREAMEVMRGQYEERCRVLYIQIADLIQERQKHVEFLETVFRQITDLRRDVASMAPAPPIFLQASPEAIERLVAAQATRALGPAVPVRSATEADVATLREDLRRARFTIVELQRQVDDLHGRPKHFDEGRGLYEKFEVRRTDGSSEPGCKHHGCRYFIIDYSHDPFAPVALCAYASACQSSHPQLATEILDLFSNETIKKSSTVQVRSATEADIATLQEALHQARLTNQDFRVGDTLLLREWNPETGRFTGHHIDCGSISHIQSGGRFGIPDGYCLLSFRWPIYISYAPPHPESDPCSASSSALPSSSSSAPPSVD